MRDDTPRRPNAAECGVDAIRPAHGPGYGTSIHPKLTRALQFILICMLITAFSMEGNAPALPQNR